MPFITQDERKALASSLNPRLVASSPGQRCYVHYKWMKEAWDKKPRWTTADWIYSKVQEPDLPDSQRAKELAWQVFFQIHVMPYELKQREKNGEVT